MSLTPVTPTPVTSRPPTPAPPNVRADPVALNPASARLISSLAGAAYRATFGPHVVPTNKEEDVNAYIRDTYGPGKLEAWNCRFGRDGLEGAEDGGTASEWILATIPNSLPSHAADSYPHPAEWDEEVVPGRRAVGFLHLVYGQFPHDAQPPLAMTELVSRFLPGAEGEVPVIELSKLYLLEAAQGLGIGTLLMDSFVARAEEYVARWWARRGADARRQPGFGRGVAWLGVWESNHAALKFYRKHGYRQFSKHDFVMGDDVQIDLLYGRAVGKSPEEDPVQETSEADLLL
ncbi:hypothetical protein DFJ74DRAFT_756922 [Hyaloraphidium curvatum]|nr:hypothetical protein DFJ74DRAFT_756922 [Hyaloraphidium curvatum]